ncbi:hypothetical protein SAMN05216176_114105 [Nitratireductor indicus]|nr:hypothetical protein SAMN05216176_114105 [Nitratireductor indicus]
MTIDVHPLLARLRHVDGFPALGPLRRLRTRFARSPVASANRPRKDGNAGGFPSSTNCPLSAVGADSTPCGLRHPGLAGFPGC